jgi:hypothetical protein
MSIGKLDILKQHQTDLILAEAIGWLHDYRKCSEEHLEAQAAGSMTQALPRTELVNTQPNLQNISLQIQSIQQTSRTVALLLNDRTWNHDILGQFISRCHRTAHFEKQEPVGGEQNYPGTQRSSPFGFEQPVGTGLTNGLWSFPWQDLSQIAANRQNLQDRVSTLFSKTVADSRRPINEVDLWSWGFFVGALYKTALAGTLLTRTIPAARDLQWRLLNIRVNGLDYISSVARIPDLLARQHLLAKALDKVRDLLAVEYPLGSEVYRDQNGSIFIVPDVTNLLEIADSQGVTLQAQIIQAFTREMNGDLLPGLTLERNAWWGQDPNWSKNSPNASNDKLPDIKGLLAERVIVYTEVQALESFWQGKAGKCEICSVCRLRPVPEGKEACEICLKRRGSRITDWRFNPRSTIWMDEIADHNGRVALIVGKFGLDDWLSGDLVQTMLVQAEPNNPGACVPKNSSPARLRRIWETCQRFWSATVVRNILANQPFGGGDALRSMRVAVIPDDSSDWQENLPYDGTINGRTVSLLWQKDQKRFITISNLQLGVAQARDEAGLVQEWHGCTCMVALPNRPGRTRTFTVQQVKSLNRNEMHPYAPHLSVLESPDRFLALVPAAEALEISHKIKGEYEKQMGKVKNRLPLFLGLVFFPRKTPLLAAMDAARRMLAAPLGSEQWTVAQDVQNGKLRFENGVQWDVPTVMGDGTPDEWYPHFFVPGVSLSHHIRRFQLRKEGNTDPQKVGSVSSKYADSWLVHVNDLRAGDVVAVTPSRFSYLWLDNTARRFAFDPSQDLFRLDELSRLMEMWDALIQSGISMTGLRNLQALLQNKGVVWGMDSKEFEGLANTALRNAGLFGRKDKEDNPLPNMVTPQGVFSGRFARCLELHLHILKKKIKED